ncbi:MAG: type II toxin-antitoxin system death-on-curing family toxin [Patescibacteria group bacterium]|nr:type II toxin-antitoxin system death-on-curing family toxin [Patescibacteria group bacterium]
MSESKWLTPEDFQFLCFDLASELMSYGEPIPDYSTRENSLLESALGAPRQTYNNQLLYPTFTKQATILFYSLIKNHPFKNGNKRIAVMALLAFLSLNTKWINMEPLDLYKLACNVSESPSSDKDSILKKIEGIVTQSLVQFPNAS